MYRKETGISSSSVGSFKGFLETRSRQRQKSREIKGVGKFARERSIK